MIVENNLPLEHQLGVLRGACAVVQAALKRNRREVQSFIDKGVPLTAGQLTAQNDSLAVTGVQTAFDEAKRIFQAVVPEPPLDTP